MTLYTNEDGTGDVGLNLIEDGFLLVESRRERRLQKLVSEYRKAQNGAKNGRVSSNLEADWAERGRERERERKSR